MALTVQPINRPTFKLLQGDFHTRRNSVKVQSVRIVYTLRYIGLKVLENISFLCACEHVVVVWSRRDVARVLIGPVKPGNSGKLKMSRVTDVVETRGVSDCESVRVYYLATCSRKIHMYSRTCLNARVRWSD
jgi:hypothetical protein